jgi:glycosyltransferase involved in cell wall biosynthesis
MASGHVFVQPSLYDATSTVVVEALGHGLPVVCLDHCGFRDVVDATCGIRIPPTTLENAVQDFAEAIERLWRDEDYRYELALGAKAAAARLTWRAKQSVLEAIYDEVLA